MVVHKTVSLYLFVVAFGYFWWIAFVPGGFWWLLVVCNRSLFMVVTGYWFLLVRASSFLLLVCSGGFCFCGCSGCFWWLEVVMGYMYIWCFVFVPYQ